MNERVIRGLSTAAILLGFGHVSLTLIAFDRLSFEALWFGGSGLAIILAGALNLFASFARFERGGRALLAAANLATIAFFVLVATIAPEPQVIGGLLLFVALLALQQVPARRPVS